MDVQITSILYKSVQSIRWNVWGIQLDIEQVIELNRLEVYKIMLDKGFSVKAIASIFSVSEESIDESLDVVV